MSWQIDLQGELALVTGGTRNIGLAIAQELAAAGAQVAIWGGADRAALESARQVLPDSAPGDLVDLASEAAIVAGFDALERRCGPVTILVNNAAMRPHVPLVDLSAAAFNAVLQVNLTAAFVTSRELFRRLPAGRNGAIVNIGGISAHRPARERAHVVASKAGLVGLTRALAEEGLGRVRANCIVPGAIDTDRRAGQRPPRFIDAGLQVGKPADIARAVVPLADPTAPYLTGQTVHVSGGRFMS